MSQPELDIVIVSWNTKEMTLKCLKCLYGALDSEQIGASVFLVDNKSQDGSAEAIREAFPQVSVIKNDANVGFAVANNQAIRLGQAPYVLLLNSDCFLHPGALSQMVAELRRHDDAAAVGPRLLLPDGSIQHSVVPITTPFRQIGYLLSFCFPPFDQIFKKIFHGRRDELVAVEETTEVPLLSAACLMIRRSVFRKIGLLPEDRFLYSEEDDLFFRMKKSGFKSFYLPKAVADHVCGGSTKRSTPQVKFNHFLSSRLRYLYKNFPASTWLIYLSHLFFYRWTELFLLTKSRVLGRESDQLYLTVCRNDLRIVRDEWNRLITQGAGKTVLE